MTSVGLPEGTKLGRYEVVKHLARGGMADLAVARTRGLENFERHVVIKHLRPEQAQDDAFVKMFVTEARLAGALHHHNIVQVHDIGQDQGTYYMAMEYVHGEDVRNLLTELRKKNELTPLDHVVAIVTSVAAALHHAHEQTGNDRKPLGIVHRDVTPGNIIVGFDGNVKVVDFGIAKAAMRTGDTQVGMLKGKVPYMAPEQVTGKPVDRRSDIFALGIVLYELITVRRLFKGGNEFYTMSAVVGGEIPPPSTHRPDLPKELEAIVMKALSRKPAERYQTAEEMRAALERFAEQANLRISASSLAAFMKKVFGERLEPWMRDGKQRGTTEVDFDRTEVGLATVPEEVLAKRELPRKVPTTRGSLIEQARLDVIAAELPPAQEAKSGTLDDTKPPAPPKLPPKKPLPSIKAAVVTPPEPVKPDLSRARTDVDVPAEEPTQLDEAMAAKAVDKTDVANPPPMPLVIVSGSENAARESTAIVTPLPSPDITASIAAEVGEVAPRRIDRKWLLAGGIGAIALVAALVIVMTGGKEIAKREKPMIDLSASKAADPPPENTPPPPDPEPVAAANPPPEPAPVEPTPAEPVPVEPAAPVEPTSAEPSEATTPVEPTPAESTPAESKPVEAKPAESKPAVAKRPVVRKRPVAKTTAKTTTKTTTTQKPATWDPNALFLKPKK